MSKRKPNISPSLVGELFIDGSDNIYRLLRCDIEPLACMRMIGGDELSLEKPISAFADFVQLKPVRPLSKPSIQRKTRSDKGIPRKKSSNIEIAGEK